MKETSPSTEIRRFFDAGITVVLVYNLIVGALGSVYSLFSETRLPFLKPLFTIDVPIQHPIFRPIITCLIVWWIVYILVRRICHLEWVLTPIVIMDCFKRGWLFIFCIPRVIFVWCLRWVCRWVVIFVHIPVILCVISYLVIGYR